MGVGPRVHPAKSFGARRLVLIEFNELCPALLDRWMAAGELPNFRRFREMSEAFVTESDEREAPNLEPWIQWYSLHSGLAFDQHRVFHLADGPRAGHEDIWRFLSRHGRRVGNFGSMNAAPLSSKGDFYLADPWCATNSANPPNLQAFQDFVSRQVREYSRKDGMASISEAAGFSMFMLRHGLRAETAARFAARLSAEKIWDRGSKWKRATLLDLLQMDVFFNLLKGSQADFATFFSNSTAHFQHAYWRHMDPKPFLVRPAAGELAKYGDAILFGYKCMDKLLSRFFELEHGGTVLVLATALSQQPFLRYEQSGGQHFYRPRDVQALLDLMGVHAISVEPTMTNQFNLHCAAEEGDAVEESLLALRMDGEPVFLTQRMSPGQVYFGCRVSRIVPAGAVVTRVGSNEALQFSDLFYLIEGMKSGRHHPDGVLWIKTGVGSETADRVSILDVFPTIAEMVLGGASDWQVTPEGIPRRGDSLVSRFSGLSGVAA